MKSITLEQFDAGMQMIDGMRNLAARLAVETEHMEERFYRDCGMECRQRDPGLPCWTMEGVPDFYDTPRQLLEAKMKLERR